MSRRQLAASVAGIVLVLAACASSGSATPLPICVATTEAAALDITIVDFGFEPSVITSHAGQVVGFTNSGFESHNVTLDDGACQTATLDHEQTAGLLFNVPGSYPVHCTIHPWLTGTITIRP